MRAAGMCGDCAKSNSSSVLIRGRCASCMQFDGPPFAVLDFGLKQGFQVVQVRVAALPSLFGERSELRTDGGESQRLRMLRDACGLKTSSLEAHACTARTLAEKSWSYSIMVGRGRS